MVKIHMNIKKGDGRWGGVRLPGLVFFVFFYHFVLVARDKKKSNEDKG